MSSDESSDYETIDKKRKLKHRTEHNKFFEDEVMDSDTDESMDSDEVRLRREM